MANSRSKSKIGIRIPAGISGLLVAWATTVIWLSIGAVFIENEYIEIKLVGILSVLIVFLSSTIGCTIAKIADKDNTIPNILIVSGSYITSMLISGMLFFDGITERAIIEILAVLAGALIVLFIGNKGNNKAGFKKRRKSAYR